ncbi:DNA-processing protein DprA [Verminephrobacter aporrectodeae]|uniref:DNA-processing protein DprA n=1 Tax=Verminephrobacter aporrectodeae subsp. tuberculatae TaxID=1110392 RepID=A0ABT3KW43_9BURK|nr:DNA-processing protein DprA [Verminephrobacter aporrectodeae]MCW5222013.1 DNA-processing protein DprA [Verminephrobacter aporrectodeae subsp. tuberculatae]MCW5258325.1 DNA-processing protein DprA [Verminephrobacter aporrectodeae subsp. tuberculatae]MCW5291304.1 DNA-processing protein DprA [Verminephrobacter aporrectodeae subsp. tuberculatae]MCW5322538.1 DNA-processing protein DprA [Verminephrobacter aporrectodeae subsp. tuberculatae]MCW8174679.1 DNA-processing protein DprA [Verminephrobacte
MTPTLSPNARAILLLTAPLIAGRGASSSELLSPGEYKRLARHLREMQRQPADLVSPDAADLLRACQPVIDEARLQRLLGRGFLLSQAIERWQARAIWVVSRADAEYPRRLKARLREDAPAVIYGCGDMGLLESGGLAVVGSRDVDDALIDYTMAVGRLAARAGRTLVSGGAKGTDQAAMHAALEAGGKVSGVLADSLEKTSMNRVQRNLLLDGQLVLISPYDPSAGFNVGNAMQRNKLIHALADASLVVSSDLGKGGTWAGAIEQLDKLKFVPVYVRSTGESSAGLDALRGKGAILWPNPQDADALERVFGVAAPVASGLALLSGDRPSEAAPIAAPILPEVAQPPPAAQAPGESVALAPEPRPSVAKTASTPADTLFATVREVIPPLLQAPMKDAEVAAALSVSTAQAKAWLQRLVGEGVIEKRKKPAGYVVKQSSLFE